MLEVEGVSLRSRRLRGQNGDDQEQCKLEN